MNAPFFIAKRYLFSKKTHNVINIISGVSVAGIAISTAALVIVLSAFNGLEQLVISFNSAYEQDIKIESANTKTFNQSYLPASIFEVDGLVSSSKVIEEIVIIKRENQFIIGQLKGVEPVFLQMSEMSSHIEDGAPIITDEYGPLGLIGIGAFMNLNGYIYKNGYQYDEFTLYAPNKNAKIRSGGIEGFSTSRIPIAGVFSFNNRVNESVLVVPIDFAADLLDYKNEISALEMSFKNGTDLESKKAELSALLGSGFKVRTHFEINQIIYQASKTEKLLVILILTFIYFMVTFTLISSITMLVLEKRPNLYTLRAMGATINQLVKVFFFEGLLINFLGLFIGLIVGYGICLLQQKFGFIMLDKDFDEIFPIFFKSGDLILILLVATFLGTLAAWLPSRFLIKRIVK